MLSIRICLAVLLACEWAAFAARADTRVDCPHEVHGKGGTHRLADATLFDGPPEKKIELAGGDDGWNLAALRPTSDPAGFTLVCVYGGTPETRAIQVPRGASRCAVSGSAHATRASCH